MVSIPSSLRTMFSGSVTQRDGEYVITVPKSEIDLETVMTDETYRIALFDHPAATATNAQEDSPRNTATGAVSNERPQEPPVTEGETRLVEIEALGEQGDGIAKVERGYVIIVPDAEPGDHPTVEIENVQPNVAFASVVEENTRLD